MNQIQIQINKYNKRMPETSLTSSVNVGAVRVLPRILIDPYLASCRRTVTGVEGVAELGGLFICKKRALNTFYTPLEFSNAKD